MNALLTPLLERLAQTSGPAIWIADENTPELPAPLFSNRQLTLLSNRYDLAHAAQTGDLACTFSDFDLEQTFSQTIERCHEQPCAVFYRVSKERPVVNHLINSAYRLLPEGGRLYLSGQKNEGIKNYFSQAARLFGVSSRLQKRGDVYCGELQKLNLQSELLDDRDYTQLRWIEPTGEVGFLSKPGTYGWNKIDKGSQFLMDEVAPLLEQLDTSKMRLLDLGCGYGYLILRCRHLSFAEMTATDNNAAAIACMHANAQHYQLPVTAVAGDCGSALSEPYDLILCNPPFHQGFNVESTLTDKFLQNSRRLMNAGARAYFVVNAFIPLENKARSYFAKPSDSVRVLANNGQFKVIEITSTAG